MRFFEHVCNRHRITTPLSVIALLRAIIIIWEIAHTYAILRRRTFHENCNPFSPLLINGIFIDRETTTKRIDTGDKDLIDIAFAIRQTTFHI